MVACHVGLRGKTNLGGLRNGMQKQRGQYHGPHKRSKQHMAFPESGALCPISEVDPMTCAPHLLIGFQGVFELIPVGTVQMLTGSYREICREYSLEHMRALGSLGSFGILKFKAAVPWCCATSDSDNAPS